MELRVLFLSLFWVPALSAEACYTQSRRTPMLRTSETATSTKETGTLRRSKRRSRWVDPSRLRLRNR